MAKSHDVYTKVSGDIIISGTLTGGPETPETLHIFRLLTFLCHARLYVGDYTRLKVILSMVGEKFNEKDVKARTPRYVIEAWQPSERIRRAIGWSLVHLTRWSLGPSVRSSRGMGAPVASLSLGWERLSMCLAPPWCMVTSERLLVRSERPKHLGASLRGKRTSSCHGRTHEKRM